MTSRRIQVNVVWLVFRGGRSQSFKPGVYEVYIPEAKKRATLPGAPLQHTFFVLYNMEITSNKSITINSIYYYYMQLNTGDLEFSHVIRLIYIFGTLTHLSVVIQTKSIRFTAKLKHSSTLLVKYISGGE